MGRGRTGGRGSGGGSGGGATAGQGYKVPEAAISASEDLCVAIWDQDP